MSKVCVNQRLSIAGPIAIRISPSVDNDQSDLDKLLAALS
jgi:hypothetical protein